MSDGDRICFDDAPTEALLDELWLRLGRKSLRPPPVFTHDDLGIFKAAGEIGDERVTLSREPLTPERQAGILDTIPEAAKTLFRRVDP